MSESAACSFNCQHMYPHCPLPADDETVANMAEPPPQPSYVASGRLPLHQQAVLLEAWQFMHRWAGYFVHCLP